MKSRAKELGEKVGKSDTWVRETLWMYALSPSSPIAEEIVEKTIGMRTDRNVVFALPVYAKVSVIADILMISPSDVKEYINELGWASIICPENKNVPFYAMNAERWHILCEM